MKIKFAKPGDGEAVSRLGALALQEYEAPVKCSVDLCGQIDEVGGRFVVPFGRAHALVAVRDDGSVCGLLYTVPPVWLIEGREELSPSKQREVGERLAEVALLAVDEEERGKGVGSQLLAYAELMLQGRGYRLMLAQVRRDDVAVQSWYERRGFHVAERYRELFAIKVEGVLLGTTIENDTFVPAFKKLVRV